MLDIRTTDLYLYKITRLSNYIEGTEYGRIDLYLYKITTLKQKDFLKISPDLICTSTNYTTLKLTVKFICCRLDLYLYKITRLSNQPTLNCINIRDLYLYKITTLKQEDEDKL